MIKRFPRCDPSVISRHVLQLLRDYRMPYWASMGFLEPVVLLPGHFAGRDLVGSARQPIMYFRPDIMYEEWYRSFLRILDDMSLRIYKSRDRPPRARVCFKTSEFEVRKSAIYHLVDVFQIAVFIYKAQQNNMFEPMILRELTSESCIYSIWWVMDYYSRWLVKFPNERAVNSLNVYITTEYSRNVYNVARNRILKQYGREECEM